VTTSVGGQLQKGAKVGGKEGRGNECVRWRREESFARGGVFIKASGLSLLAWGEGAPLTDSSRQTTLWRRITTSFITNSVSEQGPYTVRGKISEKCCAPHLHRSFRLVSTEHCYKPDRYHYLPYLSGLVSET
jgi:hypothetical protein